MDTGNAIFQKLDRNLAILGSILSVLLLTYVCVNIGRLIYVVTVVLFLTYCLLWLLIRKKATVELDIPKSRTISLLLTSLFFFLLSLNILSFCFRPSLYERPLIYFILISLMAGIVALEILFIPTRKHTSLILAQIAILGLSLVWTQQLLFPTVIGIDPAWHRMFTLEMLVSGHIPSGYDYSHLPVMHLEISAMLLVTDSTFEMSAMFSASLIHVLGGILFIFLIGRFLFNEKIGLLGALLVSVASRFVQFGWWVVPTGLAFVFVLIIIYLFFKIRISRSLIAFSLAIFLMVSLVLTHTVTSMSLAILLLVIWISGKVYRSMFETSRSIPVPFTVAIFFSVIMFSWWTYASGHIGTLVNTIRWGLEIDFFHNNSGVLQYYLHVPILEQLFDNLGNVLFFAASLIGLLYMVSKNGNAYTFSIATGGSVILAMGFFSQIGGKPFLNLRWIYFAQVLLAVPFATSLFLLLSVTRKRATKLVLLFFSTASLTFLMIMSPGANLDNHMFSPNTGVRFAFTESEIQATAFFVENSEGTISSDFDYFTNPSSSIPFNYHNVSYGRIKSLDSFLYDGRFERDGRIIVIREEIIDRPFRLSGGFWRLDYNPKEVLEDGGFSKIYDCGSVSGYY